MNTPVSPELDKLLLEKDIPMPVNPTIADVVMWLYKKHGIWIGVNLNFRYQIETKKHGVLHTKNEFNSPTEAYEAAITYTLNNLI